MLTVFRSHVDPESLVVPVPEVIDCSGDPDIVRHEQAALADVNRVVARFQASGRLPDLRQGVGSEVDYDIDLAAAFRARQAMRDAWEELTPPQKERYKTPQSLVAALRDGTLDLSDPDPRRRSSDQPRNRRSEDKAAEETARFQRAVDEAAAKRSAAGRSPSSPA